MTRVAGKDASKQFWKYHNAGILKKFQAQLQVGSLDTKKKAEPAAAPAPAPEAKPAAKPVKKKAAGEESEALDPYGALIPFSDPSWYQGVSRHRLPLFSLKMSGGRMRRQIVVTNSCISAVAQ